ncbi:retrovirus-related pol polyprotein from transposon TNT 1-94 [Tanacetum coccineum]
MARQCPKLKRKRDTTWFRDKVLLVEAQGSSKVLNEEELEFLAHHGVAEGPVTHTVITHNAAYQADDLDAYDYDCDDFSTAKAVLMDSYSSYGSDVLSEVNKDNLIANESLSVELERYKERVKLLEERQNVDLSTQEKLIMDDIIREKNAQFGNFEKEINYLKQTLSEQSKEKDSLGLKAQQMRPMLYDGSVISKETNVISIADSEETLMLEEESRSKMLLKQSDPMVLEKKVNIKPINYDELNRLSEDLDIVNIVVNSSVDMNTSVNVNSRVAMIDSVNYMEMCNKCLELEYEIIKQHNMVEKDEYNRLLKSFSKLEQHCISLELAMQLNKEIFQNNSTSEKVFVITSLKNDLRKFKGKDIVNNVAQVLNDTTIAPGISMFDARHELCFLEFVFDMNASSKSKSVKKAKNKEEWKPIRKVFTKIGYNWRPTRRTFTLVGNAYPLTRITATNKVPPREPIHLEVIAQESVVTKVYTSRPKVRKTNGSNSKPKIAKSMIYNKMERESRCSKHMTGDRSQLTNFVHKFLGTVKFDNEQIAKIMRYGDYQIGNIIISRVYYVEGYGHNLFSVGQFCDSNLEVAFTWVKFLASKDEAPDFIIKFLKMIQVRLNTPVRNISIDNGTEFVNQTLRSYYESVDSEDLGKLQAKADIGIFIGYAPKKKAYRIYNQRTRKIIETIHVNFDELTAMASEQLGSGPGLQSTTPATSSLGLVPNPIPQQPCIPPPRDDWDRLFQPLFDEYFNPPIILVSPVPVAPALRTIDLADSPMSTITKTPYFLNDPLHESLHEDSTSQGLSSNVRPFHTPFESLGRWTKDHPIANVIRDPSRSVSTRKQLQTDAMWCYFVTFLTSVEPKNFKQAMTEPSWIDAMQEEIHKFERLQV